MDCKCVRCYDPIAEWPNMTGPDLGPCKHDIAKAAKAHAYASRLAAAAPELLAALKAMLSDWVDYEDGTAEPDSFGKARALVARLEGK